MLTVHSTVAGDYKFPGGDVGDEVHAQNLDEYKHELAFEPVWTSIDSTIGANERVLADGTAQTWVARETAVLRALRELCT